MFRTLITILIIIALYYFFRQYAQHFSENSGSMQKMNAKIFKLAPDETVLHQTMGMVDPNWHVKEVSMGEHAGMWLKGERLKTYKSVDIALTSQGRLIIVDRNVHGGYVAFDQSHPPKITNTGQVGRHAKIAGSDMTEGRILQFDSDRIPEIMIAENADLLEISVPQDFIPLIMQWAKQ